MELSSIISQKKKSLRDKTLKERIYQDDKENICPNTGLKTPLLLPSSRKHMKRPLAEISHPKLSSSHLLIQKKTTRTTLRMITRSTAALTR